MTETEIMFSTRDLDLYYGGFQALKKISLDIKKNEITALIGPSGCGKSTFIKTLNRMSLGSASVCLTVATAGAILSYLPIGIIASRIGRKITILCGVTLLALCFFAAFLYTLGNDGFSPVLYVLFALVGLSWAAINVNSLPMTNELLRKNADLLKPGTVAAAKESERSIVDIETLQHTNEQLISTLDEVLNIQRDGAAKRKAAEVELGRIEGELKQKLMELHH